MGKLLELVKDAKHNSEQMEILIHQFHPLISSLARRLNRTEYEDAVQDLTVSFIQVIQSLDPSKFDRINADQCLLSYIKKAMNMRYIDHSKRQNYVITTDIDSELTPDIADDAILPEDLIEIRDMLSMLTPFQQQIIINKFQYGYSDAEIARKLHITRQAIHQAKNRAIHSLQDRYKS